MSPTHVVQGNHHLAHVGFVGHLLTEAGLLERECAYVRISLLVPTPESYNKFIDDAGLDP